MKSVTSKDPRKKQVVSAIKRKSGGNKVTNVKQLKDGSFQGHAMKGGRYGYESLGEVIVTAEEAGIHVIKLSNEDFDRFTAALENPPEPNEKLKEAFRRHKEQT